MKTQVYKIRKGRKTETVRATSMKAINKYCNENGYNNWSMAGMMSRLETLSSKGLKVVA